MSGWSARRSMTAALAGGCVAALVALPGCAGPAPDGSGQGSAPSRFASQAYQLALDYPVDIESRRGLRSGYFFNGRWNPDASAGVSGDGLLTLTLPGSNKIRFAMLRLGASHDPRAVGSCRLPRQRRPGTSVHTQALDGVVFRWVESGDAGMSHYLRRRSYRAVHAGVYNTPPPTPFSMTAAFQQLAALLDGLSFSG